MTTKLPTDERPLVQDPDLAAAIEGILKPLTGEKLAKAQAAIRQVRSSAVQGTYTQVVEAYREAILRAVASVKRGASGDE